MWKWCYIPDVTGKRRGASEIPTEAGNPLTSTIPGCASTADKWTDGVLYYYIKTTINIYVFSCKVGASVSFHTHRSKKVMFLLSQEQHTWKTGVTSRRTGQDKMVWCRKSNFWCLLNASWGLGKKRRVSLFSQIILFYDSLKSLSITFLYSLNSSITIWKYNIETFISFAYFWPREKYKDY